LSNKLGTSPIGQGQISPYSILFTLRQQKLRADQKLGKKIVTQ